MEKQVALRSMSRRALLAQENLGHLLVPHFRSKQHSVDDCGVGYRIPYGLGKGGSHDNPNADPNYCKRALEFEGGGQQLLDMPRSSLIILSLSTRANQSVGVSTTPKIQ